MLQQTNKQVTHLYFWKAQIIISVKKWLVFSHDYCFKISCGEKYL